MPYSFDPLDEEQKKKAQEQQGGAAPSMTGGGQTFGAGSGGGLSQGPQADKGAQTQGSGFVGLDKYMAANRGNNFGNQVTGKVQGDVDQAKQGLASGTQAFTDASNQGTTRWNDVQGDVKNIVDNAGSGTSADDVSKYQGLAGAKYQGPESFLGSAYGTAAQGKVQKAAQAGQALQSEGGRFALLDNYFGRPNYSMGEKSLDNLLVQNAPGVAAKSQLIGGETKKLSRDAGQTEQSLNNLAASNRQATQDTAKNTKDYLGNANAGFQKDLDQRYQQYKSDTDASNAAMRSDLADNAWDQKTMAAFGVTPGTALWGVNAGSYLQDNPKASLGQFASDQDYAKYLAMEQLAGEDPSYLSAADRDKAGTGAAMGSYTVDQPRFQSDVQQGHMAYNSAIQGLHDDIDSTIQKEYDRGVKFEPGGTGYNAVMALKSLDPQAMQAALDAFGGYTGGPIPQLLQRTLAGLQATDTQYGVKQPITSTMGGHPVYGGHLFGGV